LQTGCSYRKERFHGRYRGKAAGVSVFNNTGNSLGINESGSRVVIRGMNAMNTSTDPLCVVDGVQMNEIHSINPADF
jgi:hypothetical protein